MNQPLCHKCNNYEIEGNDARCKYRAWPKSTLSKTRLYNALMFECIEYERPLAVGCVSELVPA